MQLSSLGKVSCSGKARSFYRQRKFSWFARNPSSLKIDARRKCSGTSNKGHKTKITSNDGHVSTCFDVPKVTLQHSYILWFVPTCPLLLEVPVYSLPDLSLPPLFAVGSCCSILCAILTPSRGKKCSLGYFRWTANWDTATHKLLATSSAISQRQL